MAQTSVSADITTNTTWNLAGSPYILQRAIFVKGGATLTILPGVVVRGQPRTAAPGATQVGVPGSLIVTQTGRIVANGSASNPIIMTTAATDNNDDGIADDVAENAGAGDGFRDTWEPGDTFLDDTPTTAPLAPLDRAGRGNVQLWGGLVILGNAPINDAAKCSGSVGFGKCTIEGMSVPGFAIADVAYGGIRPHDNSGIVRYVSIRHAGDEIGGSNELNGLSLGGVGDGTTVEYVEVYANFDDGFEWFGGTVNTNHLVTVFVGDDMFDMDEGYTGVNQFLFGIMPFFNQDDNLAYGSASGDKANELDGDNFRPDLAAQNDNVTTRVDITGAVFDPTPWPLSYPAIYNETLIGSVPDAPQEFTPLRVAFPDNRGIQMRNGFAGDVFNSIVVNTGTGRGLDVAPGTESPGFGVTDNANNDLLHLVCSTLDDGVAPTGPGLTAVSKGDAFALRLGGAAASANSVNPNPAPNLLVNEDQTFDPKGNAAGKLVSTLKAARIDPRPRVGLGLPTGGCPNPPTSMGLDPAATYRGAFVPGAATPLWTNGWTALSMGGLL